MRTLKLFTTAFLLLVVFVVEAQTSTKGFKFQGFADTPEGEALKGEAVTVRFTIYPKTGTGFIFEETQEQKTDNFGIFYAHVGEINPDDMQKINFTAKDADYWMKVEVKKTVAGVYSTISDTELLATPYARHAANGVPVGTIISFAGGLNKIPEGWLLCDGKEYDGSEPEYKQLYNMIGTAWGNSGGTAFNVPELRGTFLRGLDKTAGNDPDVATRTAINVGGNDGDKVGSFQTDTIAPHLHSVNLATNTEGNHNHTVYGQGTTDVKAATSADRDLVRSNGDGQSAGYTPQQAGDHSHLVSDDTQDFVGSTETRPKNVYVAYIIKY